MHMDARRALAEEDNKSQDCAMYLTSSFSDGLAEFAAWQLQDDHDRPCEPGRLQHQKDQGKQYVKLAVMLM